MKKPFTIEEQKVLDLMLEAHSRFLELNVTHISETTDWVNAIHQLQHLLSARVLRRDYPETFK